MSKEVSDREWSARLIGFDFRPQTRVVFGIGVIDRLGELTRELGARRVLVVTDPGIAAAGHLEHALWALGGKDLEAIVFDQVHENPTTRDVDACLAVAREARIDAFIGLGGGSSIDTARGCNFLLSNGGRMQDYWGVGKATQPMLPMIAVPTTAGTGSECQSFALIADEATHQKMACGDPKAAARVALLDPALTVSQPRGVTACTGVDALAHALETAVTTKRNELSRLYSREAFRLINESLPRVLSHPGDLDARASMQLGAAYSGMAIENSMLGAAHAAANPLTAHFGMVHGQAVGVMLPHVIRFNSGEPVVAELYRRLAVETGLAPAAAPVEDAVESLVTRVRELLAAADMPLTLSERGVSAQSISDLSPEAARQWTARVNPREIGESEFQKLYLNALGEHLPI